MDKEAVKNWFNSKENKFLVALLIFTSLLLLYYFFKLGEQSIWWDEGDYLAIAKVWATGMETPVWWAHFTGMRPLLMPIIWFLFMKIGLNELIIRFFTLLIPSIITIYLVYAVGRDLYNKKTGLIAGFMMSVYWVFLFYSFRLLTDIPSVFFGMLSLYFFWSIYTIRNKNYGIYLAILFGVLAFSTRFALALVPLSIGLYLIFIKKFSIVKDKVMWKSLLFLILFLSPYLIYFFSTKFYLFTFYFGAGAVSVKQPIAWNIIPMLFSFLHLFWQVALILGIISLYPLFVGFDIFWKQKDKNLNPDFFIFFLLLVHIIFYVIIFRAANDRWLLMLMPLIFILSAKGVLFLYGGIKKYSNLLGIALVILIVFGGAYQNITHANSLIELKKSTYLEVKLAGEWLKQNSPEDAKIVTASIVQNQYYSERQSYDFYTNDSIWKSCIDLYGTLSLNETCQKQTEEAFNKKVKEINPSYLIVSIFEPVFTPQWAYTYPQRYNMTVVQGYMNNQNQPILVIYKF